jgi:hypothetical protein
MKKVMLLSAILLFCLFSINNSKADDGFPFGIGPYVTLKSGVNANSVPNGIKNGFNINPLPDFGATIYFPLSSESKFGITCDLGYTTYSYKLKWTDDPDNPWTNEFSYFTINPNLHIYGFLLGISVGFPMNANTDNNLYKPFYTTDNLNTLFEVRIGGMIPIFESFFGRLNILISGGYVLSGIYKENQGWSIYRKQTHYRLDGSNNPHPAWMSIGLSYIFNLNFLKL